MLPYSSRLSRVILLLFFLLVIGYGFFEAQAILWGPRIEIASTPTEVTDQYVRIQGSATHIASLSMNGAEIPVTESGEFDEPFLLADGENRILLEATDRYGNTTEKTVTIYYTPEVGSGPPASTTSSTDTATTTAD